MEALNLSRVCNAIASIGIMRRAYMEARNYAFHREAFGKKLAEYPMVKETLTHLAVKQEIETSTVFSLVELFDKVMSHEHPVSEKEMVLNRLLIALLKRETAEQAIHFSHEAIEMHGGNGFIEDFVLPRLLRDAQVLTVWEGTANILGLEVLRLMNRHNAHKLFIEEMKDRLNRIPASYDSIKEPVLKGLKELEELTEYVAASTQDTQTFHAKKIGDRMTAIYESWIGLEEASNGGERERAKAEIFIGKTWGKGILDKEMKAVTYFDLICNPQLTPVK
jgi:acyl-CoA dehydrogenase